MKTIKIIALAAALTASMPAFAQETQRLTANKHNEYGLIYSLPKTHVNIEVEAVRTVKKAGPYYRYAEKYLGVKNPITETARRGLSRTCRCRHSVCPTRTVSG